MPYLTEDQKYEIEKQTDLKSDAAYFASMSDENFAGSINYWNHVTCRTYINEKGIKYWRLALVVGTLLLTIFEIVRRVVNPYEDEAIERNGDIKV